ncbi:unnamed protein product, partial [Ectocarpus sp. 13 AM-2016]
ERERENHHHRAETAVGEVLYSLAGGGPSASLFRHATRTGREPEQNLACIASFVRNATHTRRGATRDFWARAKPCDRPFVRYWRAAIMSTSGGPSTAAVKADQLRNLAKLVEESRPWYEALEMTAEKASGILGEDAKDYVSEQGSGLGRKTAELLFSAADVDALKPVCIVFKALFDALKGAAKNRNDLIDLIHCGVLLVKSIP